MTSSSTARLAALRSIIRSLPGAVVAFSGGVDSSLLARVAHDELGDRAVAVTGVSASLAPDERSNAQTVAREIGIRVIELSTNELADPRYAQNGPDRCYFCKSELFDRVLAWANERGLGPVLDGLNADDDPAERPGVRAADERGVRSPLREAGLAKNDVREVARLLGLSTAEKPASPCLASRIPHGTPVTAERLVRVARAESSLRGLGLEELRVRYHGELARVEVPTDRFDVVLSRRLEVMACVREAGFRHVTLDLGDLRSGGAERPAEPATVTGRTDR